ncbi:MULTISPECIES: lipase family protein [Photorhabdus]|uniref:Pdl (Lipase family) protein n=2 Tax=Photorhabdus asymbiotica TaxID=291112 RepID=B6VNC9_PHOAA|nr:lipase family protein [Photorhabdus asymbiotica]RKS57058.1 lipase (class 3) [Photorhabdus asymbiotica]CAQ84586.1 pdl (lipase family) protein [Photorhabdus asymbiotica]CAR67659.1 pdl (lipase family) protein [Photorhabdus asymbiotica subsp. asymbiotica ATCC 43949]
MSTLDPRECFDCRILKHWVEFQLVDEQGKPLVNMPYSMVSRGLPDHVRRGKTDGFGVLREEDLSAYPVKLYIDAQSLADEMEQRPLREIRSEEASVVKPKAEAEGHQYRYVTIGQISDGLPSLKGWDPKDIPPPYHFPNPEPKGYQVHPLSRRYVLEVCPFRAWVLQLHHQKEYSIVNAYNQSLMSVLAYASGDINVEGSVPHFFNRQMVDVSKLPDKMETLSATPVVYDVPFSERYTRVEFVNSKAENKQGNTHLFYVANKHDLIISWRGTTNMADAVTDATYQPLGLDCDEKALCSGFIHSGKVHKGFWNAFSLVGELRVPSNKNITVSSDILDLVKNKRLFVCGHSLGGALALLHSAQLKEYNPCLYSYGMPRTLTRSAVQELATITHYRHVNEDDPVPAVPPEKNLDNWLYNCWGPLGYLFSPVELLDFTNNGEVFLHHGKIVHFCKINLVIEWLEERNPSNYIRLRTTLPTKTKLYLIPSLNSETENNLKGAGDIQKRFFQRMSDEDKVKWFPQNENPALKDALGFPDHSSLKYARYIGARLAELVAPEKYHFFRDQEQLFEKALHERTDIVADIRQRDALFLQMDHQLKQALICTQQDKQGLLALTRYTDNAVGIEED